MLDDGINDLENIWHYDWHINTKYYTADIHLCYTTVRTIGNKEFAELVQAVIIYFDPKTESSFEKVKSWLPYLNELSPPILILVCDTCSEENVVKRSLVQKWCIQNDFELVELSPQKQDDGADDDDFHETTGIKRIIQALHAHTWSNLVMKDNPSIHSPYMRKLMEEEKSCSTNSSILDKTAETEGSGGCQETNEMEACDGCQETNETEACGGCNKATSGTEGASDKQSKTKSGRIDELLPQMDDMALFDTVGEDDPGGSFESMFAKFSLMKEKAESLPPELRKAYAEKVAIAFWKAMGGEEDEIGGLDCSDDEQ